MPAMIFVTPFFIEPEWYFLPFYGILRALPYKTLGTLLLIFSIIFIYLIVFIDFYNKYSFFLIKVKGYCIMYYFISLGIFSIKPLIYPYYIFSFYFVILFLYILFLF
jgi:quinol-cytochrome oxidoreductase complex cytochrome b subunit